MKKVFIFVLFLVTCVALLNVVSCGKKVQTYIVTYENVSMNPSTVEENTSIPEPTAPTKTGYRFVGWFLDATCKIPAVFPLKITADLSLYAKYDSYEDSFAVAREKTIGAAVNSYEYEYTTDLKVAYSGLELTGKTVGSAKYNKNTEVSFYDEHVNSEILFYDGTKYQIKNGNSLQKISTNENGEITKVTVENVDPSYKFDSSSYAKALFTYEDKDLKEISETNIPFRYKLKTSFNASSAISVLSKVLNNKTVQKLIGNISESNVDTGMYVTFKNEQISSYEYQMKISVAAIELNLTYFLKFKNVNGTVIILPKTFPGLSISKSEVNSTITEISKFINDYKAEDSSSYKFVNKTGVDFGGKKNEINTTFNGKTVRSRVDGKILFFNETEIDTDFKNADLYKADKVIDQTFKRAKLTNGEVYVRSKKEGTLFGKGDLVKAENYNKETRDEYYLLDVIQKSNDFVFTEKKSKGSKNTYRVGLTNKGVCNILRWFNSDLAIDPTDKLNTSATVYGNFDESSVASEQATIEVIIENGKLLSIELKINGEFKTAFPDSRDFTATDTASFKTSSKINVTDEYLKYTPFSDPSDI